MAELPNSTNIFDFVTEATKEQSKLRLAISGPSGSGKTFSAINILMHMGCQNIVVLDTEHGSAAKYSNEFHRKFKVIDNTYWQSNFDPRRLIAALRALSPQFDGIVVDSLTHFWMGTGGMLSLVDGFAKKAAARGGKYDSFGAWKEADPIYNELVQTILGLPCHFAACLRAKSEYDDVVENGKKKKVKVGMASQMRDGFEFEFDVAGMMDMNHNLIIDKTRCRALDELIIPKPGANIAEPLIAWLTSGTPVPVKEIKVEEAAPAAPDTERAPPTEPLGSDVVGTFVSAIEAATTTDELKLVANDIKTALKDKKITQEDYTAKLSPAYAVKNKALRPS